MPLLSCFFPLLEGSHTFRQRSCDENNFEFGTKHLEEDKKNQNRIKGYLDHFALTLAKTDLKLNIRKPYDYLKLEKDAEYQKLY